MNKYKIIALVGEAGSGKDRALQYILKKKNNYFQEVIHTTTRPPRDYEKDGKDYYFITKEKFNLAFNNNEILAASEYNNWCYGISLKTLSLDKINIGVLNLQELDVLKDNPKVELCIVYLQVNDKERLRRQLSREKNPNVKEIVRRFSADMKEFARADRTNWNTIPNQRLLDLINIRKYVHRVGSSWASLIKR